jgi:hypothetical protein
MLLERICKAVTCYGLSGFGKNGRTFSCREWTCSRRWKLLTRITPSCAPQKLHPARPSGNCGSGRPWHHECRINLLKIASLLVEDAFRWVLLLFRSAEALRTENLFLRRQLALHIERGVRLRRVDPATRTSLALLARHFDWRDAMVVVQPATMIRWHRAGWRLLWRLKSRAGRLPIPKELGDLIRRMARENVLWGEERIANELLLK